MRRLILLTVFLLGFSLFAQGAQVKTENEAKENSQFAAAVEATEKSLDQRIFRLNEDMTKHTVLFKLKVDVLPFRTVFYKGKEVGDECNINLTSQEDPQNNCVRVEVFDFVNSEDGKTELNLGSKNKSMTLFFEGANSNEADPRKEPARKLKRIKSKILNNNFVEEDSRISEVVDNGPNTAPQHNDKITVFYQHDGNPEYNRPETPVEKGVGKYLMESVENTKTNPIRNNFKRDYYVKHLDYFDRLFTKIFDYNDRDSNSKYKEANTILKGSLKY